MAYDIDSRDSPPPWTILCTVFDWPLMSSLPHSHPVCCGDVNREQAVSGVPRMGLGALRM